MSHAKNQPRSRGNGAGRSRRNDDEFGKDIIPTTDLPPDSTTKSVPPKPEQKKPEPKKPEKRTTKEGEPLSLAEEIAEEGGSQKPVVKPAPSSDPFERAKSGGVHIAQLQQMSMTELIEAAKKENVEEVTGQSKQDLIFKILKERVRMNGLMFGEGTLEILPDGFGFLRSPDYHYLSCPDDIYVSPSQIRRFGLKTGCTVSGQIRPPERKRTLFRFVASRGDQLQRSELDVSDG